MKKYKLINKIGEKIHQIRIERNLSVQYVAKETNISKSMLDELETNRYISVPSRKILKRIADVLNVKRRELTFLVNHEIGQRIRNLRKDNRETQTEFAYNINTSHDAVSHWERGDVNISQSWINYIAHFFHVQPRYLMCQSDKKRKILNKSPNVKSMTLFSNNPRRIPRSKVMNPVEVTLDTAIDKQIPVKYHGVKLSQKHWDFCRFLIKDWCHNYRK